jgi:hypothetical protein
LKGSREGRWAALLAGGGLLTVAALVAIRWRDLEEGFYLQRLRARPAYLKEIAAEPETSPAGRALRSFVKSASGREALLAHLVETLSPALKELGAARPLIPGSMGLLGTTPASVWYREGDDSSGLSLSFRGARLRDSLKPLIELQPLLFALEGRQFTMPGRTESFTVLRGQEALRLSGLSRPDGRPPSKGECQILIRPAGEPASAGEAAPAVPGGPRSPPPPSEGQP